MSTQSCSFTITPAPMDPVNWMKVADSALKEHPMDDINTAVTKAEEKEEAQREAKDKARWEAKEAKQKRVKVEKVKVIEVTWQVVAEREREQWVSGSEMAMSDYPIINCMNMLIPKKFLVTSMKVLSQAELNQLMLCKDSGTVLHSHQIKEQIMPEMPVSEIRVPGGRFGE
ncbi:hypothetical protein J3A83DRAFT_4375248 [Scleroderma citrinum]